MGAEDEEWVDAESEQLNLLAAGTGPDMLPAAVVDEGGAEEGEKLPAPEFEGPDGDGYLADQLVAPPAGPPAPPVDAPVVEAEAEAAAGAGETEAALGAAGRRRSMGGEDEEWAEAEGAVAAGLVADGGS